MMTRNKEDDDWLNSINTAFRVGSLVVIVVAALFTAVYAVDIIFKLNWGSDYADLRSALSMTLFVIVLRFIGLKIQNFIGRTR